MGVGERAERGTDVALHPCSTVSVSMVTSAGQEGGGRARSCSEVRTVRLGPVSLSPALPGVGAGGHSYQPAWAQIPILGVQCC